MAWNYWNYKYLFIGAWCGQPCHVEGHGPHQDHHGGGLQGTHHKYVHEKNSVSDPNLFVLLDKSEKNLKNIIFVKYFKCINNQLS